jgi:hypothetical protein
MNSKYIFVTKTAALRVTSAIKRGLVFPLVLLGALAATPPASAGVVTNHHGSIGKNYAGPDANFIYSAANGTTSHKSGSVQTEVTCPLTRRTTNSNGAVVFVDVRHDSVLYGQSTFCVVSSFNIKGEFLGSASESWAGEGFHEFVLDLSGAGKSDSWGDYSVTCFIPGHGRARVLGVDLSEQ